jgi:translation initiation factor IF-3
VSLAEALRLAGEQDVDLVEVVAAANPVCRLMVQQVQVPRAEEAAAEAKSKQKVIEVKKSSSARAPRR